MKYLSMRSTASGFTLIELVITIVILGILAAVVMLNFGAKTQHGVITQADELRRNLSHIQLLAISQGVRLKLSVAEGGYSVCPATPIVACALGNAITDPATGAPFSVTLTDATFNATSRTDYFFDTLGRPVTSASGSPDLASDKTITLSGSDQSASVTVFSITGFAQAN